MAEGKSPMISLGSRLKRKGDSDLGLHQSIDPFERLGRLPQPARRPLVIPSRKRQNNDYFLK